MSDHKLGKKVTIFKLVYLEKFLADFSETNIIVIRKRCRILIPNLKKI